MPDRVGNGWSSTDLKTLDLQLDAQNPRIDVPPAATQEQLRASLLETEELAEFARDIIKNKGLLRGERVIVVGSPKGHVVVEGNRRTAACQMLLDPDLVPVGYRSKFPVLSVADGALRGAITTMACDVAPSREAAEITITKRHTSPGVRPWTPVAKQRRIVRLLEAGRTVEQIVEEFGETKESVLRQVRNHNLLRQVADLKQLTAGERKKLLHPRLRTNAFTRFFSLQGVRATLRMDYGADGTVSSKLPKRDYGAILTGLARGLLIPDEAGKTRFDTRTKPASVFKAVLSGRLAKYAVGEAAGAATPSGPGASPGATPTGAKRGLPRAKAAKFFESLACPIKDNQLIILTREISQIDHHKFPTSATFLARALVERTLEWCLRQRKMFQQMMKEFHSGGGKQGFDPGLDYVIRYCKKHHDEIFAENVRRTMDLWLGNHKQFCDLVVHGKWIQATPQVLEDIAACTRPFVERVFEGIALKS